MVRAHHLPPEPTDPDTAPAAAPDQSETATLSAIAVGGVLGAVIRYEAGLRWPTTETGFPVTTLCINLIGSALLALVVVAATDVWTTRRSRLLRPLLGTGVLGGFTTFSTFSVDLQRLLAHGHAIVAAAYLTATVLGCGLATWSCLIAARTGAARWKR